MAKLIKAVREEIIDLFERGYNTEQVFDRVFFKLNLPEGIARNCLRSLKSMATLRMRTSMRQHQASDSNGTGRQGQGLENMPGPGSSNSGCKTGSFDPGVYSDIKRKIIAQGSYYAATEPYYKKIALDILEKLEGFDSIINGPSVHEHQGTPFDLFGKKNGNYCIIELKGSLRKFNRPGATQLARMEDLLDLLARRGMPVNMYLLQINLGEGKYNLCDEGHLRSLFQGNDRSLGKFRPIEPIADWIADRMGKVLSRGLVKEDPIGNIGHTDNDASRTSAISERIVHPPHYIERQIRPAIKKNNMDAEVVWTYILARIYENDIDKLAGLLCGKEEPVPSNSRIWLEAYLHPTRAMRQEQKSWKTRADLAIGCLENVQNRKNQLRAAGDWIGIAEAKWFDDIHENSSFPEIYQFSQLIEHAILMPNRDASFPERVYVTLITPRYFKDCNGPSCHRLYATKYLSYIQDKGSLVKDLKLCPLNFYNGFDLATLISRVDALTLRWITFEELLGVDELVEPSILGKYGTRPGTWGDVLGEVGKTGILKDLQ